jgi:hypothetical protein
MRARQDAARLFCPLFPVYMGCQGIGCGNGAVSLCRSRSFGQNFFDCTELPGSADEEAGAEGEELVEDAVGHLSLGHGGEFEDRVGGDEGAGIAV